MHPELKKRLKKLNLLKNKVDAIVLFSGSPSYFYFTNTNVPGTFVYDFQKPKLFVNKLEQQCAESSWIKNIYVNEKPKLKGKIGFENSSPYIKVKNFHKDITNILIDIRTIKTDYEIKCIRKACRETIRIFSELPQKLESYTENSLAAELYYIIHSKSLKPAFPLIIASGINSSSPHHEPKNIKIKTPVVIDIGINYKGYGSDVTRTIGTNTSKLEQAMKRAECKIKNNVPAKAIDKEARDLLGKDFRTALGHGIGLAFEKPVISPKSRDVIKNKMCFTLEPGLYKSGKNSKGCRIENTYLFDKKLINLTKF
jgi:Xaa-Pro aminopeptidase